LAAVLPNGFLATEMKMETALARRQRPIRIAHRLHDRAADRADKRRVGPVIMHAHRARRMMGMGAVDQEVRRRNAGGLFDFRHHRVKVSARHHQEIVGHDRKLSERLFFQHHRHSAQLAVSPFGESFMDPARNHHRIIRLEFHGRCTCADAGKFFRGRAA
jgi:hypothetical protein